MWWLLILGIFFPISTAQGSPETISLLCRIEGSSNLLHYVLDPAHKLLVIAATNSERIYERVPLRVTDRTYEWQGAGRSDGFTLQLDRDTGELRAFVNGNPTPAWTAFCERRSRM
jgi:hypothetical protein